MWTPPVSSNPKPLSDFIRRPRAISHAPEKCWIPPVKEKPDEIAILLSRLRLTPARRSNTESTDPHVIRGSSNTPLPENYGTNLTCDALKRSSQRLFIESTHSSPVSERVIRQPVQSARKLSCPYQNVPCAEELFYLYEFRLPHPEMLANLVGVAPECFDSPKRTIGLLFSKLVSEDANVCRIPLYLTHGMARAYIQLTREFMLSAEEFRLVLSTHQVLCDLLCEGITRDLYSVTESDPNLENSPLIDQFMYDPKNALVCALLCIVQWPSSTLDFEASRCLLSASFGTKIPIFSKSFSATSPKLIPHHDIIPFRRTPLDEIDSSFWRGRLLRSITMASCDLGLLACAGPDSRSPTSVQCFRLSRHFQAARAHGSRTLKQPTAVINKSSTCSVHPLSAWLWFNLTLIPVVLYQLNRALCSVELGQLLRKLVPCSIRVRYPIPIPDRLDAPKCMLSSLRVPVEQDRLAASSNLWPTLEKPKPDIIRPTNQAEVSNLMVATTTLGADDMVNLERLEFWGDSFIKLMGTLIVYNQLPQTASEGDLTSKRVAYLTNTYLADIVENLHWSGYCTARPYLAETQFLPPTFVLSKQADESKHQDRLFVTFRRKSLSDMLEALVGYLLTYSNLESAFLLLTYGSSNSIITTIRQNWPKFFATSVGYWIKPTLVSNLTTQSSVEGVLNYHFRQPVHLVTALRHQSATCTSENSSDYQRLEFLGDAVLDYVITSHIYNANSDFDPGVLTSCRSSITNNNTLSYMMVKLGLHQYVEHANPHLPSVIQEISRIHQTADRSRTEIDVFPSDMANITASKILADVFEALIGAVFLDSGGDLVVASKVAFRCLSDRIDFVIATASRNLAQIP
ncbi:hypothetical protein FGIG_07067 [Fasciola gigantica]|uniref:RNase III domain-containing protein n=1 Tax=Fasciola gigantica TaxID=46835 RepID=A0A504YT34_FASGI|nr:hypothetical protein FGIG_07067 [Fasciola gigantica]